MINETQFKIINFVMAIYFCYMFSLMIYGAYDLIIREREIQKLHIELTEARIKREEAKEKYNAYQPSAK